MNLLRKAPLLFIFSWCMGQSVLETTLQESRKDLQNQLSSSQKDAYQNRIQNLIQKNSISQQDIDGILSNKGIDPFSSQLLNIWHLRLKNPELFKNLLPFSTPAPPLPTQLLMMEGRLKVPVPKLIALKLIPLEMLHSDHRLAVARNREMYQHLLEIRKEVTNRAQAQLDAGSPNLEQLATWYQTSISYWASQESSGLSENSDFQLVLEAAQLPSLGYVAPRLPRLDPETLPAWEEVLLMSDDIQYKRKLVELLVRNTSPNLDFCLGMVAEQAIEGFRKNPQEDSQVLLLYQVFDFYRDHPSRNAARSVTQLIHFTEKQNLSNLLPIGKRFDSLSWLEVLIDLEDSEEFAPLFEKLGETRQLQK